MFRRRRKVECFFCGDKLELLSANHSFKGKQTAERIAVGSANEYWCSSCGETTTLQHGVIVPDQAAHHDSSLNEESFSRRATPNKSRIPGTFASSPFCRQCMTNQALQMNLLASFPDDNDSDLDSPQLPHLLEEYKTSLESRYPIVCPTCAPVVEQTIAERDYVAQTKAWGWALRESKKAKLKAESDLQEIRGSWRWRLLEKLWTLRGGAWWITHLTGLGCAIAILYRPSLVGSWPKLQWTVPLCAISVFWAFWDPTWLRAREERSLGRPVKILGRRTYLVAQAVAYTTRLSLVCGANLRITEDFHLSRPWGFTALLVFAMCFLISFCSIRLETRPRLKLSGSRPSVLTTPAQDPLEPLADLSLSPQISSRPFAGRKASNRKTATAGAHPAFGTIQTVRKAGFPPAPQPYPEEQGLMMDVDDGLEHLDSAAAHNSMDWTPLTSGLAGHAPQDSNGAGWTLAPQRFFAPQEPTGLEHLFEKSLRVADEPLPAQSAATTWWRRIW